MRITRAHRVIVVAAVVSVIPGPVVSRRVLPCPSLWLLRVVYVDVQAELYRALVSARLLKLLEVAAKVSTPQRWVRRSHRGRQDAA